MKGINLFFHSIKQGLANLRKNRMFTLASMGTIAACLFVFGLFYFVLSNFQNILHSAEQSVGISVFFEENLSEKQIADIGQKIEKRDEVERVEYISAAQAWEDFKQENFSKTPELAESFGDDNPLADSASYAIYCKDLERQSTLVEYLKTVKGIRRIKEADEIEEGFSSVNKLVGGVSLVLIVVLLLEIGASENLFDSFDNCDRNCRKETGNCDYASDGSVGLFYLGAVYCGRCSDWLDWLNSSAYCAWNFVWTDS